MLCSNQEVARAIALLIGVSVITTMMTLLSLSMGREPTPFWSLPVINNHSFAYIHNDVDFCTRNKIDILLVVPSAAANFVKRQTARDGSRGEYVQNATNHAAMLFFLGKPSVNENMTTIQQEIDQEAKVFGDIIQEDFEDVYKNNRLKSVAMLRWISKYCTSAKYVIRTDDDIGINISSLVPVLERTARSLDNFMIGRKLVNDVPARDVNSKYYMSLREYPKRNLPPYLLGGLVGYPASTAKLLYEAALRVKPIWLEDVYISGMCAPYVNVTILSDPEFTFQHKSPAS
ncbi:unnamed protein product [Candidula unifasciata]|uniref:Hexosyltransferase n=1 Tax=Candidula unifasciata TaxID=100452 RepID=A0A8S3Z8H8_9EUPU|nr:unnamed protein product [Candidula unifasciata]